jgi:hypothetical protein
MPYTTKLGLWRKRAPASWFLWQAADNREIQPYRPQTSRLGPYISCVLYSHPHIPAAVATTEGEPGSRAGDRNPLRLGPMTSCGAGLRELFLRPASRNAATVWRASRIPANHSRPDPQFLPEGLVTGFSSHRGAAKLPILGFFLSLPPVRLALWRGFLISQVAAARISQLLIATELANPAVRSTSGFLVWLPTPGIASSGKSSEDRPLQYRIQFWPVRLHSSLSHLILLLGEREPLPRAGIDKLGHRPIKAELRRPPPPHHVLRLLLCWRRYRRGAAGSHPPEPASRDAGCAKQRIPGRWQATAARCPP